MGTFLLCLAQFCASKTSETPASYKWSSRRLLGSGDQLVDEGSLLAIATIDALAEKDSKPVAYRSTGSIRSRPLIKLVWLMDEARSRTE